MKKVSIFIAITVLLLSIVACNRSRFNNENPTQPTLAPTLAQPVQVDTSTPEPAATQAPATETTVPQLTDTVAPTQGASQSDAIANQLDSLLSQFNSQLQSVDTLPDNP